MGGYSHSKNAWYKPGSWNAVCDICGLRFKSDELKKNWKNEMVCKGCFELRHPQEFVRVRPEKIAAPWVRPETDVFVGPACMVWDQSAYAGLAMAGCAAAARTFGFTGIQMYLLKNPPSPA